MEIKQLEPKEKIKTSITDAQLNDVVQNHKDWFLTADNALKFGIVTEIV